MAPGNRIEEVLPWGTKVDQAKYHNARPDRRSSQPGAPVISVFGQKVMGWKLWKAKEAPLQGI